MDPEWKEKNYGPKNQPDLSDAGQSAQSKPIPGLPTQPDSIPPVGQDEFAARRAYAQTESPSASSAKKIVVMITVFVLLVIPGVGGAYFLLGKDEPKSQEVSETPPPQQVVTSEIEPKDIEVPAEWKPIETELGFNIKGPDGWGGATLPLTFSVTGIEGKSISIAELDNAEVGPYGLSVTVGTQTISDAKTQAEFESFMTDPEKATKFYSDFGLDTNQIKITGKKFTIGGKEWLQVETEMPDQFTTAMYLWNGDHAISLTVFGKDKAQVNKLVESYLYPMTASVELK